MMSAYASIEQYIAVCEKYGLDMPTADEREIKQNLSLASVKLDEMTFGRVQARGFESLTEYQKEKVVEFVSVQADYISSEGYSDGDTVDSYSVLDISVTASSQKSESERLGVSALALSLLRQSGLMERMC